MTKYYKVLTTNLTSIIMRQNGPYGVDADNSMTVQYKIGEFVESDSGLYVFDTLQSAIQFRNNYRKDPCPIYEVEVRRPTIGWFIPLKNKEWQQIIRQMLKNKKNKKKYLQYVRRDEVPEGTKCFKEVKLIRRVNPL